MDNGEFAAALNKLDSLKLFLPESFSVTYERAYCYNLMGEYVKTIEILDTLKNHPNATDIGYQLLGNTYDKIGKPEKALETYAEGMGEFPYSGKMYLESGIVEMNRDSITKALNLWEKGIQKDPNYPSNYYHLSRTLSSSKEKLWSMLYGEIFLVLEPNGRRHQEISKLLLETNQKTYVQKIDASADFNLIGERTVYLDTTTADSKSVDIPFGLEYLYNYTVVGTSSFSEGVSIDAICNLRESFLKRWFDPKNNDAEKPKNALLNYRKKAQEAGVFKAYSKWLLAFDDIEKFEKWRSKNAGDFSKFVDWFNQHPINLKLDQKFAWSHYN